MTTFFAKKQKKPVVKIVILNLMPNLKETERQLLRMLDTPMLDVRVDFVYLKWFTKDFEKRNYLKKHYLSFEEIKNKKYDGAIITGAPLEHFEYEDIHYIKELNQFLEYSKTHVYSTLFICWAAIYSLHYFYHISKTNFPKKISGLYPCYVVQPTNIVKNLNDSFFVPHSRYCGVVEQDILLHKDLKLVSKSNEAGVFIVESKDHKQVFFTGHAEYEKNTLELEYLRDLKLNLNISKPVHYYLPHKINDCWHSTAILLYHNWLYYYVFHQYE